MQGNLVPEIVKHSSIILDLATSSSVATAADYVIHMDPWWNPAVEDQASDRAHRMGQKRPVTIYRFVCRGTIEERILELHARKRDLADGLLDGTELTGKLSAEELMRLISL